MVYFQGKGNSKATDKKQDEKEPSTNFADEEKNNCIDPEQQVDNFNELSLDDNQ